MMQSLLFEILRSILRLSKEIWEAKWQIIRLAVAIRYAYGSFTSFWSTLTQSPTAPFSPLWDKPSVAKATSCVIQGISIQLLWQLFRNRQVHLLSLWKNVDISYFVQLLPEWSALRGFYFLMVRLGPERSEVVRVEPWHFRHTLVLAYVGSVLWAAMKRGGTEAIFNDVNNAIQMDFYSLTLGQAEAAFRQHYKGLTPPLDYRHKPRFAWAATCQALALVLAAFCVPRKYSLLLVVLSYTVPVTSVATMLLFATYGHHPDYLNTSMSHEGGFEAWTLGFCETCKNTAVASPEPEFMRKESHHLTTSSLQRSADSKCRICATLWERRTRIHKDFVKDLKYWEPATTYRRDPDSLIFSFKQDPTNTQACRFQICKAQEPDPDMDGREAPVTPPQLLVPELPNHTGSDDSLKLAAKWLQNCLIYHGVCSKNRVVTFKPSRLLWLGDNKISIHLTEDMPKKVLYLTLSHCWGKSQIIRLLCRNHDALRTSISWNDLPRTFQDAVSLVRRLGFLYLWIDSLCIIQDSAEDWDREAKLMGQIYKYAVCNIAASDGHNSSYGCFYPRNPYVLPPVVLPSKSQEEEYLINETDIYDDHILYTRAWVLQEALLARRTLDCARGQLFWRCGEMRASEVFPSGVPRHIHNENHPASKFVIRSFDQGVLPLDINVLEGLLRNQSAASKLPFAPGKGTIKPAPNGSAFGLWAAIVVYYTDMNLTRDIDRVVALSGIVDIFCPFFGAHHHGLWRIFMPVELLWVAKGLTTRPSTPRAPTWSWMSLEGAITYEYCKLEYGVDTLVTRFVNIESEEHETRLRLSTRLLRAEWRAENETTRRKSAVISSIEGQSQPVKFLGVAITTQSYGEIHFDHCNGEIATENIFCMPIKVDKNRYLSIFGSISGLVLQEVRNGIFVRLGLFEADTKTCMPFIKQARRRDVIIV